MPVTSISQPISLSVATQPPPVADRPPVQPSASPPADRLHKQSVSAPTPAQGVRFFFFSDNHSRLDSLEKIRWKTQMERPDLVIDGGDWVHDGTEPEIQRAMHARHAFPVPVYMVTGNHDAHLRGPFKESPPQIPPFQSFDVKGIHFILLDNQDGTLSEEQFQQLEADLRAHQGKTVIVAMHVPAKLSQEPFTVKWGKMLPLHFASPVMRDKAQVERFHRLMDQFDVAAVLSGHTHYSDELVQDGVRYLTVGSSGGLSPKPGLDKEYLEIQVENGQLNIKRVKLEDGKGFFAYAAESFDFYRDLNDFNHQALGWKDFYPSANVGYQAGFRRVVTGKGDSVAATVGIQAERLMDERGQGVAFASLGVSAGTGDQWDMGLQGAVGYKRTVYGDYNRGAYLTGAATVHAGYLHGGAAAGVGVRAGIGAQYQNWTVEFTQEWASHYKAQNLSVGFRF